VKRGTLIADLAGLVLVAGVGAFALWPGASPGPSRGPADRDGTDTSAPAVAPRRDSANAGPAKAAARNDESAGSEAGDDKAPQLPSQAGTQVDGGVTIGPDGHVVPDLKLRRLFEYFLTGMGRASIPQLRALLARNLKSRDLPPGAAREALSMFDRYMEYRRALGSLSSPGQGADGLQAALDARYNLRRRILGRTMAEGFFSREEAIDRYAIESRRIRASDDMSAAEKQRRLNLLEQQLPPEVREAQERSRTIVNMDRKIQKLRQSGAGEAEIHAAREQMVGTEAAERLAQLDRKRAQWKQRMADYRKARQRIMASDGLAPEDKQAAIDQLIKDRFSKQEAIRVRALDRIAAQKDSQ